MTTNFKLKFRDTFFWENVSSGDHIYTYKQLLDICTSERKKHFLIND